VDGGTLDDVGGGGLDKHGTYVAGTIASQRDGRGSVGIWPQAKVVSVRVFDPETGTTSVAAYLHGLERCVLSGAKVVNLSLSGLDSATSVELSELEDRIGDLRANWDFSIVAAAGNSSGPVGYPARFSDVFAVGASDTTGGFCSFSSRGDFLDISTFGCGLQLSWPGGGTATGSGTSFVGAA
jgi:subtilisin